MQKAIELNQIIGSKYIVMASPGQVTTADSWKAVADRLNAGARDAEAARHGRRVPQPRRRVAAGGRQAADGHPGAEHADKTWCCSSTSAPASRSGADPVAWINANPGRIKSMHCKDWKAGGAGYAVLFGEGDAPWAKIFDGRRERPAASSTT